MEGFSLDLKRPAGILLDFYGTVVVDDDAPTMAIAASIADIAKGITAEAVGQLWWNHFEADCNAASGTEFRPQRELAISSLQTTLDDLGVQGDPVVMAQPLFTNARCASPYPDAEIFLRECPLPICVLSDIDRADIQAAIDHGRLSILQLITSEDARSYKPAAAGFLAAAEALNVPVTDLWHIGDSLSSDIAGANALDMVSVWINRKGIPRRSGRPEPVVEISELTELLAVL